MKERIILYLDKSFFYSGLFLTGYMLFSAFHAQDIAFYQSMFILGIFILSGLLAIREGIKKEKFRDGFAFWLRLIPIMVISVFAVLSTVYLSIHAPRLDQVQPYITDLDLWIGWFLVIAMILLCWIHWGAALAIIIAISTIYFFWGHLLSPPLGHAKLPMKFVMSYMGMSTTGGIFWMVSVAADQIYFLVLFASLLLGAGILPMVMEVGKWAGNHIRGGAAFPAIIGSTMVGSVMGQAVSNVMLTGQLTIPMMKKKGFHPAFAGAIEATASSVGQFMPPIMGESAFIIAAFLNIPYIHVAMGALPAALLYVIGITIAVLLAARMWGYGLLNEVVDWGAIYNLLPAFLVSFVTVLILLLYYISPGICGIVGSITIPLMFFFRSKKYIPSLKTFLDAVKNGFEIVTVLCLLLIAIGPIAQMAITTNFAGALGVTLSKLLPETPFILLFISMAVALIIGMGLPTPACYLLTALFLLPFLAEYGFKGLQVHFFIFYFAVFSALTPPVAVAALAGSRIANARFMDVCMQTWKIVGPTCTVGYALVYNKVLIEFPKVSLAMGYWFLVVILLMFLFAISLYGFFLRKLTSLERIAALLFYIIGFIYMVTHSFSALVIFYIGSAGFLGWIFAGNLRAKRNLIETS